MNCLWVALVRRAGSDINIVAFAAGGLLTLSGCVLGLVAAIKNDGRVLGWFTIAMFLFEMLFT